MHMLATTEGKIKLSNLRIPPSSFVVYSILNYLSASHFVHIFASILFHGFMDYNTICINTTSIKHVQSSSGSWYSDVTMYTDCYKSRARGSAKPSPPPSQLMGVAYMISIHKAENNCEC